MNNDQMLPITLTIATVVRNDLPGLQATLASAARLMGLGVEHWVIDGSTDSRVSEHLRLQPAPPTQLQWISEPDQGIYDAMNKALARAHGDYILFINAGDTVHPQFDLAQWRRNLACATGIVLGRVVEVAGREQYLNPGFGHEAMVFEGPPHQATFYPRSYYASHRFNVELKIGADGFYTREGIAKIGATFIAMPVAEFQVGGVSSTWGKWSTIKRRVSEATTAKGVLKVVLKALMWQLMPRSLFYRMLASYKYTRLRPGQVIPADGPVLRRLP